MKDSKEATLAPFEFHGVEFTYPRRGQPFADCPFCGKEEHFFAHPKTRQWDCKACGLSGNLYTFLTKFLNFWKEQTKEADYQRLAKLRKIPAVAFEKLAWDGSRWLLPVRSQPEGSLTNIRVFTPDAPKPRIFGTSEIPLSLVGLDSLELHESGPIYVLEGDWDGYAFGWLASEVEAEGSAVYAPGAGYHFREKELEKFKGQDLILPYDNDKAGKEGMAGRAEQLKGVAKSVRLIVWKKQPENCDVNDTVSKHVRSPKKAWDLLHSLLVSSSLPEKDTNGKAVKVPDWKQVLSLYTKYLKLDKGRQDALAACFAVAFSIRFPGDPLWLYLVGAPGSGKTLILQTFRGAEGTEFMDTMPHSGLISGYNTGDNGAEDTSPLVRIVGKCLIVKEFGEILRMPSVMQNELFGQLGSLYDGAYVKAYKNKVYRSYPNDTIPSTHFSWLAGITHKIHSNNQASLGERFLKLEFLEDDHDEIAHIRQAVNASDEMPKLAKQLSELASAFLCKPVVPSKIPQPPAWAKERIIALAALVGLLRTYPDREYNGDLSTKPRTEIGSRLAQQLIKLGRFIAFVRGTSFDNATYRIVERIGLDTAYGWHLDFTRLLLERHPRQVTVKELELLTSSSRTTLLRRMQNMKDIKLVTETPIRTQLKGHPQSGFQLTEKALNLWKQAKIGK